MKYQSSNQRVWSWDHPAFFLAIIVAAGAITGCADQQPVSPVPATPPAHSAAEIEHALTALNPYFVAGDAGITFNRAGAEAAGLDPYALQLGDELAPLATAALKGEAIEDEAFVAFTPFFEDVAERIEESREAIESETERPGPGGILTPDTHCPGAYGMSTVDAIGWLVGHGYHRVPAYASLNYPRDYAKFIGTSHWPASFWPCWTYRAQGIASPDNHAITFQSPEPNPELGAYSWTTYPGAWWGPFVAWWHRFYC